MNQQATADPQTESTEYETAASSDTSSSTSTSDWLAERKNELREVLENKSRELSQKTQEGLSQKLGHYQSAVHKASESLEADSENHSAKIAASIAQHIKDSADYLQNTSPDELVAQSGRRVRKSPLLAMGVALAAGLFAGRIISSARDEEDAAAS